MSLQWSKHVVSVLLAALVVGVSAPPAAAAKAPIESRPATAALSLQARVGGPTGPEREIFGFALASSLSDPTVGYPSWDFSLLTTVAFFGLHVNDNGTLANDSGWTVWSSAQLTNLVSTAHASGTKVVVTVVMQDFSSGTPHMCAALAHYPTTVSAVVAQVRAKGVDGVNLDYEGLNGSCGHTDSSWARHMYSNLTSRMRSALPSGSSYLSVDTYASSAQDTAGFMDVPTLGRFVNSMFVMAYDLEYSNYLRPPLGCSSLNSSPSSCL